MAGMSGMPMLNTFSSSTKVTLFFSDWTTNTPSKYFGTLIFIFCITLLNRFLGAWRSQLSRIWADKAADARREQARKQRLRRRRNMLADRRHAAHCAAPGHKRSLSMTTTTLDQAKSDPVEVAWREQSQPLSSNYEKDAEQQAHSSDLSDADTILNHSSARSLAPKWTALFGGRWRAGNPWRFTIDAPRAVLEMARAFIGYLLMLAVMTFNIGFMLAVLLGILLGELFFGRFTNGTGWEEGGCHD